MLSQWPRNIEIIHVIIHCAHVRVTRFTRGLYRVNKSRNSIAWIWWGFYILLVVRSYLGGFRVKLARIDGKSCAYIIERNIFIDLLILFNIVLFESYIESNPRFWKFDFYLLLHYGVSSIYVPLIRLWNDLFIIIVSY